MRERRKMRWLIVFLFLVTCFLQSHGVENNLTIAQVSVETSITSDDDSEQELSSQLQEVDEKNEVWSSWSDWSACSRSCDGGVSHQLRTCRTGTCRGEHVRYKICNMQCVAVFVGIVAVAQASVIGLGALGAVDSAAVLAGPSGTVTRTGIAAAVAPALASPLLGAGAVVAAAPLVSQSAAQLALELSVPRGSGLEGQWIPDVNEKLYDDGSYKPSLW